MEERNIWKLTKESSDKHIKNMLIAIIIFNIIMLFILFFVHIENLYVGEIQINNLKAIYKGFSILALISCYTYYFIYKDYELLIIALIYSSYAFLDFYSEFLANSHHLVDETTIKLLVGSYIVRTLLLIQIVAPNDRVKKFITSYKVGTVVGMIAITGLISLLEVLIYSSMDISFISKVIDIIKLIFVIIHIYVLFIMAKRCVYSKKILLPILILSINSFTLKRLFILKAEIMDSVNPILTGDLLTFFGYLTLSIGVFVELIHRVREMELLTGEFKIFYDITENNKTNNVIILNKENKLTYYNEKFGEFMIGPIGRELNFIMNMECDVSHLYQGESQHIAASLKKNGMYKGVIFSKSGMVADVDLQRVVTGKNDYVTVCVFNEVTKEYNTKLKLISNESKLSTINNNIKDFIFMLDNDSIITYVNKYVVENLGYSFKEIIGKKFSDISKPVVNSSHEILEKESELIGEIYIINKDNSKLHIETIVTPILDGVNKEGKIIVGRDLRKRRELESLKKKYNEIKEYDKIREEFFANLSHEVRTPINIIYSCMQLLEDKRMNHEDEFIACYDRYEVNIKQNCYRLLRLVNNLLDLTRINSGAVKMKYGNHEIISLVEEITQSVIPYVESKGISIMFDTNSEEHYIKCDPEKIEKIVLNLISNSVKFTGKEGIILVDCSVNDKWVEVRVKDDGIGIPKAMKDIIFERFAQVDKSFNREKEGSGIGLALVKSLVELHNGEVYLEDSEEPGACFVFKLPNEVLEDEKLEEVGEKRCTKIEERTWIELSDIYD